MPDGVEGRGLRDGPMSIPGTPRGTGEKIRLSRF